MTSKNRLQIKSFLLACLTIILVKDYIKFYSCLFLEKINPLNVAGNYDQEVKITGNYLSQKNVDKRLKNDFDKGISNSCSLSSSLLNTTFLQKLQ